MKILMLISSLDIGGAETHVETLCRSLRRLGHESAVLSRGGRISERMARSGIRQILIGAKDRSLLSLFKEAFFIYRAIRREAPDIVHAHSRSEAALASPVCALLGIPLAVTAHAMFSLSPLQSALSRWGDATIAVSEDIRDHLTLHGGVDPSSISVIENGVDLPTARERKSDRSHRILFVSRLDKDCSLGALLLCEIAPRLAKKYPDLKISIAGGGDALSLVTERAKEANAAAGVPCVRVLGTVEDLSKLYANTDLFVGVSRAAIEAMSQGIPVILLGNEGFSGLLTENRFPTAQKSNLCARGSDSADGDGLFAEIVSFFELEPSETARISDFCVTTAKEHYSASAMAERTLAIYRSLIGSESTPTKNRPTSDRDTAEAASPRSIRVLLCGYFGFGNLGDDAIAESVTKNLKAKEGNFELRVLGASEGASPYISRDSTVSRVGFSSVVSAIREIKRADVFIFGGGSLLQNKTSDRSLAYYLFLIALARRNCKKLIMLANGIGPISNRLWRKVTLEAISLFNIITVRDTLTQSYLKKALPDRKILLFPDPAVLEDGFAREGSEILPTVSTDSARRSYEKSGTEDNVMTHLKEELNGGAVGDKPLKTAQIHSFVGGNPSQSAENGGVVGCDSFEIAQKFGFVGSEALETWQKRGTVGRTAQKTVPKNVVVGGEPLKTAENGCAVGSNAPKVMQNNYAVERGSFEFAQKRGFVGGEPLKTAQIHSFVGGNPSQSTENGGVVGCDSFEIAQKFGFVGSNASEALKKRGTVGRVASEAIPKSSFVETNASQTAQKRNVVGNDTSKALQNSGVVERAALEATCNHDASLGVCATFAVCLCAKELTSRSITPDQVASALLMISQSEALIPFFVVMNARADLEFTKNVCRAFSRRTRIPLTVFCPKSAHAARRELSRAAFCISMRYHASLFSLLADIPPLSLSSDEKLRALSFDLGLFPALSPALWLDPAALLSAARDACAKYADHRPAIRQNLKKMQELCLKRITRLTKYLNSLDFGK